MIAELPPVPETPEAETEDPGPEPEVDPEPVVKPKPRARKREPEPEPPKPRQPEPEQEPQPKRRGRPPKPPGAPKAKYTRKEFEPHDTRVPVEAARHIGEVGDAQVEAMTRYMVTQLGTAKRGALETRRNGWRQMIAGHYI